MGLLESVFDPAAAVGMMIAILGYGEWLLETARTILNRLVEGEEPLPVFPQERLRVLVFWESLAPIFGGMSACLCSTGLAAFVAPFSPFMIPVACAVGSVAVVPIYGLLLHHVLEIPLAKGLQMQGTFVTLTGAFCVAVLIAIDVVRLGLVSILPGAAM